MSVTLGTTTSRPCLHSGQMSKPSAARPAVSGWGCEGSGLSESFSVECVWWGGFSHELEFFRSMSVGKKAVVADTHESGWKNVEQKAPNKFHRAQGHGAFLIAAGVVLPTEVDFAVVKGLDASVGDGNPMGVAGEVFEHLLGTAERWFGVDSYPVLESKAPFTWRALGRVLKAPLMHWSEIQRSISVSTRPETLGKSTPRIAAIVGATSTEDIVSSRTPGRMCAPTATNVACIRGSTGSWP